MTEWGLNLTDGMKATIIALICRIMATVKRTGRGRQNKSRFGKGLKQPRRYIKRKWVGKRGISGGNLSSEHACRNITMKIPRAEL